MNYRVGGHNNNTVPIVPVVPIVIGGIPKKLRLVSLMFITALHLLKVSHLFAQATAGALLAKLSPETRQKALILEESAREFRQIFLGGR